MAITASQVTSSQTLEEFRLEFNKLQNDVLILKDNPTFASNLVFEGATADAFETTLNVVDPTADRTINLPNQSGTLLLAGNPTLSVADGGTIGSSSDADSITIAASGVVTFSQTPIFSLDVTITDDLFLDSDAAVIHLGDDGDVTLTHVHNTGILLNSTMQLQFNDSSQYINAPTNAILDINATDEIELNATLADVNANLDVSGTYTGGGLMTTGGNIVIPDAGNIGSASDTDAIAISSGGVVTFSQTPIFSSDLTIEDDLTLDSDGAVLAFGEDNEITITHVADIGLNLKHTATADDKPVVLTLQTGETDMAANDIIGAIQFQAPDEGTGTDAILVSAAIKAYAEGDFSSSSNATTLGFYTGSSEAAAIKMSLSSGGNLDVTGDITGGTLNADGDTSAGDNAAIGYTSGEGLILTGQGSTSDITVKNDADGTVFTVPTGTDDILFPDSAKAMWGAGSDMLLYHDGSNSYITNAVGALKIATETSGIAVTIGHSTSEVTVADNLTVTGTLDVNGTFTGGGLMTTGGNIIIPNAGNIGSASDTDAMAISSGGVVNFTQRPTFAASITIQDGGSVGSSSDLNAMTISSGGVVAVTATTANTSASDGALTVAGGLGVAADASIGDDLRLISDAAVLSFGANSDVTLTHVHDTGILLNSTMAIQFNDASQYINAPSNAILDINATDEIELNATLADVNANLDVSGTYTGGGLMTTGGNIVIPDAGNIGSASDTDAISISSGGVTTFSADIAINDTATDANAGPDLDLYRNSSSPANGDDLGSINFYGETNSGAKFKYGQIFAEIDDVTNGNESGSIVIRGSRENSQVSWKFEGDTSNDRKAFIIPNASYIGSVGDDDAIYIPSSGAVTFSQRDIHSSGITVANDGQIGSAGDTDAIAISSAGVVTLSSSTASSSKTTGALVVTGGIGTSADLYVGDLLNVEGGINIAGSNQELRFYEGANYVGFEAPALSANQIWVLPAVDADDGDVLMTDGSGTLSWSTAVSGVAANFTVSANNSTNETVYPVFVDGATGGQGAETDTGLTYNPSTGLLSTAAITLTGALTVGGTTTLNGNLVLGDAAADTLTIGATLQGASPLVFEGASADGHETTFAITDPTGDRTITFPNATGTVAVSGQNLVVADDGDIGSASATDAIQISAAGIVTLKDDLILKDAATIGVASSTSAITIASTGIVTFVDDILIKDAGTIGSASDPDAISISSGGVVNISATTASTNSTTGALTVGGGAGIAADLGVGDDLRMISDSAALSFGADSEIVLTHVHNQGLSMTTTHDAPLVRRGEDVFIVLDGTNSASANAGDNIVQDTSANDGDDILSEDEVFLHSGMQRNVINIIGSDGKIKNSVAGFAPGAI